MKKNNLSLVFRSLVFSILLLGVLSSCEKSKQKVSAPVENTGNYVIRLGYSTVKEDPRGVAALAFKNEVESKSEGRISILIHSDGDLGGDSQLIDGIINNKLDMTVSSAGNFAIYANKVGISALPYLFTTFEEAWNFMDSDLIWEVNQTLEEYNMVVLAHFDNGFRCVTTKDIDIESVEDMKGLKIRTPPNQIVMETMTELGAVPKPYSFTELYEALKEGVFSAQENPIPVIYHSRMYEVQNNLIITNHSYDAMPLVIRKELWDTISEADQQILKEAALNAQSLNRNLVKEQTESLIEQLKVKGMNVYTPDLKDFREKTKNVLQVFSGVYGKNIVAKLKRMTF